jgi:hypothetical protein
MDWSKVVDLDTLNNAYETYKNHFKYQFKTKLSFRKFYEKTLQAKYYLVSIHQLKELDILNLNYDRLVDDVHLAYNDKPRGDDDLSSVLYSMNHTVSPICILNIESKMILLDGMHRIVSSNLLKSNIKVCFIIV